MKLLAIETATEACSAALLIDGKITERYTVSPKEHTKLILSMIDDLMSEAYLKPAKLDALAFGCGPGSFTGVRIATGIIQGIGFAYNLPIIRVSNLAAVAQNFFDKNQENIVFVAMDARMDEIYWAVYQRGATGYAELLGKESVIPATAVEFPNTSGVGIGTGWKAYHHELVVRLGESRLSRFECENLPHARAIAQLGEEGFNRGLGVSAELALPVYLRDKVAKKTSER